MTILGRHRKGAPRGRTHRLSRRLRRLGPTKQPALWGAVEAIPGYTKALDGVEPDGFGA
jgi:hypothetical protein